MRKIGFLHIILYSCFIFFLFLSTTKSSFAATPTDNCKGYATEGQDCGGDTNILCCSDLNLVCIPNAHSADRPGTCRSCTGAHGDACDTSVTSGDKCCGPGLTCASQTASGATQCLYGNEITLPTGSVSNPCPGGVCITAIGAIKTTAGDFIAVLFRTILSLSGGVALIVIVLGGYKLAISQGNPEKVQQARETITSAIVGLLFVIFSLVVLQIIGVDILGLPGFGK